MSLVLGMQITHLFKILLPFFAVKLIERQKAQRRMVERFVVCLLPFCLKK